MSSCQKRFYLFNTDTKSELSSRHQAATCCLVCQYRSWLSKSIIPQWAPFLYWPHWCVIISNNLAEHLVGSAPSRKAFIKARDGLLQENFQTTLHKGQLTPFTKRKWTGRRCHSDDKPSGEIQQLVRNWFLPKNPTYWLFK